MEPFSNSMSEESNNPRLRTIRSFVRREGRFTPGQKSAMERLWPLFGVERSEQQLDLPTLFGRDAPRVLEIGFGNGLSLAEMAANAPEQDFLGIEVHRPGVGMLLIATEERALNNVRVMCEDAVEILKQQIPDNSLDRVQLFFPDPWHKKRHNKRRIVRPDFVQLLRSKLKPGGIFHMATDWQPYAEQMMEVMSAAEGYENQAGEDNYSEKPAYRPLTKFEQRGQRLGHGVWDLLFKKIV